jgi:hypothetical protein
MGCTRDMEEEVFECHHVLFDRLSTAAAEATNEATSAFLSEVLWQKVSPMLDHRNLPFVRSTADELNWPA